MKTLNLLLITALLLPFSIGNLAFADDYLNSIFLEEELSQSEREALDEVEDKMLEDFPWIPHEAIDLSAGGSRLGKTHNGFLRRSYAVRLFLEPIGEEPGSYYGLLFQYASIPSIFPQYLAARRAPRLNEIIGYLKKIGTHISIFKVVPSTTPGSYDMLKLKVSGGQLVVKVDPTVTQLKLASDIKLHDPLAGSQIHINGKKKYSFPRDGFGFKGLQYRLASASYRIANLESTWRKSFLKGDYLAAYGKLDDVVLKLSTNNLQEDVADFVVSPKYENEPINKREKIFTNPKSAHIRGQFKVNQVIPGMFIFTPTGENHKKSEDVVGRVGLFIDIFDATKSLNQDVVELALINPENPKDFLMYYEHPENGEGN